VGLEVMMVGIRTGTGTERWREREFQVLGAAMLKLQVPNNVLIVLFFKMIVICQLMSANKLID